MIRRRAVTLLCGAFAAIFLLVAPAAAQTGYGETVGVLPGQVIKISGIACPIGGTVSITLNGVEIATTTADSTGAWSADVTIPPDTAVGTYTLEATCGAQVVFTATVQVQGAELSRTGASHVGTLVAIGAAAVVLGASFVLGTRKARNAAETSRTT